MAKLGGWVDTGTACLYIMRWEGMDLNRCPWTKLDIRTSKVGKNGDGGVAGDMLWGPRKLGAERSFQDTCSLLCDLDTMASVILGSAETGKALMLVNILSISSSLP